MSNYNVYKILEHNNNQLLLATQADGKVEIAIYNDRTGNTLMRMIDPTLENFERAICILKGQDNGDF